MYCGPTGDACIEYLKSISGSSSPAYAHQLPLPHSNNNKDAAGGLNGAPSHTAPAVPLFNSVQQQQLADGSVVKLNPAEWLVDLFTQVGY